MSVEFAHRSLPMAGERANGDRAVFRSDGSGRSLFAVIDGLGHGTEAAAAACIAAQCLEGSSLVASLEDVMQAVHDGMRGSRGAAATVCMVRDGWVEACAVGNVEVRSAELRLPLVFSPGILGVRVARLRTCRAPLAARARVLLFSDGVSSRASLDDVRGLSVADACDALFNRYRRMEDDATVLVADLG